ncbi:MAG: hypothetical protein JKP92_05970 [Alphaproteobacteria bacterium]|jgi:hypothetical protein|nr:hypothetical protein [Alphaproteobacteria bacterium]
MTAKTAKELEDYVLEIPHGRREKGAARLRVASMARVYEALTPQQVTALDRIEAGRRLVLSGLPVSRMRYDDTPRASCSADWTEAQIDLEYDYIRWCQITRGTMGAAAVVAFLREDKMGAVDAALGLKPYQAGTATLFIADGLEIYVRMKGWGDRAKDLPPSESQMRAMGEVPTRLMPEDAKEG